MLVGGARVVVRVRRFLAAVSPAVDAAALQVGRALAPVAVVPS